MPAVAGVLGLVVVLTARPKLEHSLLYKVMKLYILIGFSQFFLYIIK